MTSRVEELFAWIVVGADGTEGIPAVDGKNGFMMPLVGMYRDRMESFRVEAQRLADIGCIVELRRYGGQVEVLETLSRRTPANG